MKRLLNALSDLWNAYKLCGLLHSAWNFIRDHFDGI